MTSTTWPHGLERPVIPHLDRSLQQTGRPCAPAGARDHDVGVRPGHIAAWCVGGAIAWSALIGVGWVAIDAVGRLLR